MEILILKAYASLQMLPAILAQRWWLVLPALAAVALFGRRVYCRFVCPLGIAQSLVRGFRGKRCICSRLDKVELSRPGNLGIRLAILIAVAVLGLVGFGWQWLDPYAIASRAACWFASPEFDWAVVAFALVPAVAILLLAILAGGRIWCNWICPVGTLLALVGIRPWKGDKVKKCAGCDTCRRCFE